MLQKTNLWFTKSRRAQNEDDYETWVEGGKGPLMSEDRSLTLATANDQTLFIFYGNRVSDIRMQGDVINTLQARMGTGGKICL